MHNGLDFSLIFVKLYWQSHDYEKILHSVPIHQLLFKSWDHWGLGTWFSVLLPLQGTLLAAQFEPDRPDAERASWQGSYAHPSWRSVVPDQVCPLWLPVLAFPSITIRLSSHHLPLPAGLLLWLLIRAPSWLGQPRCILHPSLLGAELPHQPHPRGRSLNQKSLLLIILTWPTEASDCFTWHVVKFLIKSACILMGIPLRWCICLVFFFCLNCWITSFNPLCVKSSVPIGWLFLVVKCFGILYLKVRFLRYYSLFGLDYTVCISFHVFPFCFNLNFP